MAVPTGWRDKQVDVVFHGGSNAGDLRAKLVEDNETGFSLELDQPSAAPMRFFVPWSSVRYLRLAEEPDEDPGLMFGRAE